ncbi:DNA-binding transcriptional LysR family regulator [Novosphingobium sp. 1529]|uniref:LysR family transcriptional regulator n=1 Tax=Novosphingobium sp. 1529 TaxID=3156424 RepID=UPI00145AFA77
MPTLRRLEVFLEAAEDCNFRRTADRLDMSQAGLSNHILLLEKELGYPVFERRRGRSPELAPAGKALLEQARAALNAARVFRGKTAEQEGEGGKIRFDVTIRNYVLRHSIMPALPPFLDRHPNIDIEFDIVDKTTDIIARVGSGKSHFGVYRGHSPGSDSKIRSIVLGSSGTYLFASPELAQRARDGVPLDELPFMLPKKDTEMGTAIERTLAENGIVPKLVTARSQFPETLGEWVAEGRGISLLFMGHMQRYLSAGSVAVISPPIGHWNNILITSLEERSPHLQTMIAFFRDAFAASEQIGPTES